MNRQMRGYINIPGSVSCSVCKYCGARPIIVLAGQNEYVVKCPENDSHYQTLPGMINIDDWNLNNTASEAELNTETLVACYDSKLNYTFFLPA